MANFETINQRIEMLIEYYQLTQNSFSIRTGMANNSIIGKIINDPDRKPSYETIMKILTTFPDISCRWLLFGEGEMINPGQDNIPDPSERIERLLKRLNITEAVMAEKMNISIDELNRYLSKTKTPDIRCLSNIANAFPEVNPTWIILNEGRLFREGAF
jgi:transcriptional regulator with XRE-family HTH domain